MGNRIIITDVGSNPQLQNEGPVPVEMIKMVRSSITVPYIVAGGIRTTDALRTVYRAGADITQIGTAVEQSSNFKAKVEAFAKVVKEEGKRKIK